jgi:hypothetical protein
LVSYSLTAVSSSIALHRVDHRREVQREHLAQVLGEHVEVLRIAGPGGHERVEQFLGQQGAQGAAPVGVDPDPVAVQAVRTQRVPLEHVDADPGPLQAVRQGESAGSAADHQHLHGRLL